MSQYTTLRKQLHHIECLAHEKPLSYETQDEIAKSALEAQREVDRLELPPSPQPVKLHLVGAEKEVA
jgi:hypothetical protein